MYYNAQCTCKGVNRSKVLPTARGGGGGGGGGRVNIITGVPYGTTLYWEYNYVSIGKTKVFRGGTFLPQTTQQRPILSRVHLRASSQGPPHSSKRAGVSPEIQRATKLHYLTWPRPRPHPPGTQAIAGEVGYKLTQHLLCIMYRIRYLSTSQPHDH